MVTLASILRKLENSGLDGKDLEDTQKREIDKYDDHPVVKQAKSGDPDAFIDEIIDLGYRKWYFLQSLIPHKKDKKYNDKASSLEEIFPSIDGFKTEGITASDNPLGQLGLLGGGVASFWTGLEYCLGKMEALDIFFAGTTIAAGVIGLINGGINRYEKAKKRLKTLYSAKFLSKIFKKLYGKKDSLIDVLDNLTKKMEPGDDLDDAMRKEIDKYEGNLIFEDVSPDSINECIQNLWEEKWERGIFYKSRFVGSTYPHRRDEEYNEKLKELKQIFPYVVEGFRTEGITARDSPPGMAFRNALLVMILGKCIEYGLPGLGINISVEGLDIYKDMVQRVGAISMLVGGVRGIKPAHARYQLRLETSRQAERLSEIRTRLYG